MLGLTLKGLLLGGGTPGTALPLTRDPALAQLTRPRLGYHPHDEGVLHRFISSVRLGGTLEGQLRRRSVTRRSQDDDDGRILAGSARRFSAHHGGDHPDSSSGPVKAIGPRSGWLEKGVYRRTLGHYIVLTLRVLALM